MGVDLGCLCAGEKHRWPRGYESNLIPISGRWIKQDKRKQRRYEEEAKVSRDWSTTPAHYITDYRGKDRGDADPAQRQREISYPVANAVTIVAKYQADKHDIKAA